LAGEYASFCVSYAHPEQIDLAIAHVGPRGILLLDNGAWSIHNSGGGGGTYPRDEFWSWANYYTAVCPQAVAVIPDVIDGDERENLEEISRAIRYGLADYPERTMGIWHTADSQDFLALQLKLLNFVGVGSAGQFDVRKHRCAYLERLERVRITREAMRAIHGRNAWVHLMRGLDVLKRIPWAESADSCNVAVNHCRGRELHGDDRARVLADRLNDETQSAAAMMPTRDYAGSNFEPAPTPPAYQSAQSDLFGARN
jgi:hypothetical protein